VTPERPGSAGGGDGRSGTRGPRHRATGPRDAYRDEPRDPRVQPPPPAEPWEYSSGEYPSPNPDPQGSRWLDGEHYGQREQYPQEYYRDERYAHRRPQDSSSPYAADPYGANQYDSGQYHSSSSREPGQYEPNQYDSGRPEQGPTSGDPWTGPLDGSSYPSPAYPPPAPRGDAAGATQKLPAAPRTPPPPPTIAPPSERGGLGPPDAGPPPSAVDGRTTRLPTPPEPPRPGGARAVPGWLRDPGPHPTSPDGPDHGYREALGARADRADPARRAPAERRRQALGESRPTVALPRSNVRRIPADAPYDASPTDHSGWREGAPGPTAGVGPDGPTALDDATGLLPRDPRAAGWQGQPGPEALDPHGAEAVPGARGGPQARGDRVGREGQGEGTRPRRRPENAPARDPEARRATPRRDDAPATAAIGASAAAVAAPPTAATARRGKGKAKAGPSLGQASGIMAIGTIASRASGFLRTVAIAAAIGTGAVGDAYNVANTTPNILYDLLLGGILTSVVVPVMVRAAKEDPDGGDRFASSLLTLMILGLGVATVIGMVAAPWITNAYLDAGPAEQRLATDMLRWFLPQIIFYGVGATVGAILNVRQSFAAPMFAPILNNLLVIVTCVSFIYVVSGPRPPVTEGPKAITDTQITVLAGGTTLGVVAMTVALLPALRRVGFRYRPRLDLRHPELRSAARLAGWTLLFVVVSQAGYLVIVNLSTASTAYTIYTYGYQIFQLPYAIIGVSVITALLPRMSGHAAQGRHDLVRADISTATRVAATAIVPAALFILALGRPIAVAVFHHGAVNYHDAIDIGDTLSAFALALVPFSLFQVQLRAFYAYQDSRTPALVNMAVVAVNVLGAVILTVAVPEKHRAPALALAFAAAYLVGLAAATTLLRRRLGSVDGSRTARVITQVAIAAGFGAVIASLIARGIRGVAGTGFLPSAVAVVFASVIGGALFGAVAVRMGIHEVSALVNAVGGRFGRRRRRRRRTGAAAARPASGGGGTTGGGSDAGDRGTGRGRGDRGTGARQSGNAGRRSRAGQADRGTQSDRRARSDRRTQAVRRTQAGRNGPSDREGQTERGGQVDRGSQRGRGSQAGRGSQPGRAGQAGRPRPDDRGEYDGRPPRGEPRSGQPRRPRRDDGTGGGGRRR